MGYGLVAGHVDCALQRTAGCNGQGGHRRLYLPRRAYGELFPLIFGFIQLLLDTRRVADAINRLSSPRCRS